MINKGELCMDYQSTDELARQAACEKLKEIAKLIKNIRKKYYLCFSQISAEDQKRYDELKTQMEEVAKKNGLEKLKTQLMKEIDTRFSENKPGKEILGDEGTWYIKFVNAIAMQAELTALAYKSIDTNPKLAKAYFKKAKMCQNQAKEYEQALKGGYSNFKLSCDRLTVFRDVFGELTRDYMPDLFKVCYNISSKNPSMMNEIRNEIGTIFKRPDISRDTGGELAIL
jgi:hypothetical protein